MHAWDMRTGLKHAEHFQATEAAVPAGDLRHDQGLTAMANAKQV